MPTPPQPPAAPPRRPALEKWLRHQEAAQQPIWPIPPHLLWEAATPATRDAGRCEHRWSSGARCAKSATHGLHCRFHAHRHSASTAAKEAALT